MADLWDPVPLPDVPPGPPEPERKVRVRRRRSSSVWAARLVFWGAVVVIFAFVWLTQTDRGAGWVVEQVLRRLPIQGEITAQRALSDDLLDGVRLYDVSIRGSDGRLFLLADSVRLAYNWRTLVSGDVVFDSLDVWRPSVMVTRYPGEKEFNAQRLFVSQEEAQDTARAPLKNVAFYDVAIHGGEVRVLYPGVAPKGSRLPTIPSPTGSDSVLVRHTFAGLDAVLPSVLLQAPDSVGQRITVDSLSMLAEVLEDPVRVRNVAGRVSLLDERLFVDLDRFALDHSTGRGTVLVDFAQPGKPLHYAVDVTTPGLELADLDWLDPRIGEGHAVGGARLDSRGGDLRTDFRMLRVTAPDTRVQLNGGFTTVKGEVRFQKLELHATPLALDRLQPWLDQPLPVKGTLEGDARFDGTLTALASSGHVTLQRPGSAAPVTADYAGTFHLSGKPGAGVGFTDLHATLDPFDFALLAEIDPNIKLSGAGRVVFTANGRTTDAIQFSAEAHHRPTGLPASDVTAQGTVRKRGDAWVLDVGADLQPLSLTALARDYPDLPVTGNVSGTVSARGLLSDLTLQTDLSTEAGKLAVTAHFDAEHPGQHYSVEGQVAQFALSKLAPSLPQPTTVTGYVSLEGRGTDPATLTLDARARLRGSRVGGLIVDTLGLAVRARQGVLQVDTLAGVLGGVAVRGTGSLALARDVPAGTLTIAFQSDSLARLRPLAFGDVVIARDTLTDLDRELLLAEGVNPDTLPARADVELAGAVNGQVTLSGSVRDFAARGSATFGRVRFQRSVLRGATVDFEGSGLPGLTGRFAATVDADSLDVRGRGFAGAHLQVEYTQPRGHVDVQLRRRGDQDYSARAGFELHRGSGRVDLEDMALRFDSLSWKLEHPAVVAWDADAVRVENLALSSAADSVQVAANGTIPRRGAADLSVHIKGLPLQRVAAVLQREDLGISGRLDLDTHVTGTSAAPVIAGSANATDLDFEGFALSRFGGQIDYADRTLKLDVGAFEGPRRVLTATGQVPVDLAFVDVQRRVPADRQMDLSVVADSMPAALAFGYFNDVLKDIQGAVSGQFRIAGTVNDPEPSGVMTMTGAAWTLEELGVRHFDVHGNVQLRADGVIEVALTGRSGIGVMTTSGTVDLHPLSDPTFNLLIGTQTFLAVQRPDITGTVSGSVTLTGTYSRPVVTSVEGYPVRIDEGDIYVEEFERTLNVVDLADPTFFSVVDTTLMNLAPLLGASANPFLRNMRVAVDLTAERNAWLRGQDIDVEMGGSLQMLYDRQRDNLVLLGALNAIRGTYSILGRRFDVQSGTVEFVGTPGINPQLNITATTLVQTVGQGSPTGGDNLAVTATVGGTLLDPRVALATEAGVIAQSDLVSYLVFGVPSYQLANAQQSLLRQAAGGIASFGVGTIANQLSTLVSRPLGLDYLAISSASLDVNAKDVTAAAANLYLTTIEIGKYLEEDVFASILIRPLANTGNSNGSIGIFGGVRVNWQLQHSFNLQASYQDQDIPLASGSLGGQQVRVQKVAGLSLFRDWGYGRRGPPPPAAPAAPAARPGIGFRLAPAGAAPSGVGLRWHRVPTAQ